MLCRRSWFYFSFWLYCSLMVNAIPVGNKISEAFETQDKMCSMQYTENEGSYKKMFESLSGLTIPESLKEYDKKSYTGFKVLRTYNIQLFNLGIISAVDFVFCREGKIQWAIRQQLEDDIDWVKPLCVYIPDASPNPSASVAAKNRDSKQRALEDLKNFHCFKLARRKKYTNRQVSIFLRGGWVGGIFYCDLNDEMKKKALEDIQGNLRFKGDKGKNICTKKNSIPLVPMRSDDYSNNWIEFGNIGFNKFPAKSFRPQMTKYVPYLNTPNDIFSRLNFENNGSTAVTFSDSSNWRIPFREQVLDVFRKNKMFTRGSEPWFSEIAVDESYHITPDDFSRWQKWTDLVITKLGSITTRPSKSFISLLSVNAEMGNNSTNSVKRLLKGILKKVEFKIWNQLQLGDKIMSILDDDPKRLQSLQMEWNNLQMDPEKFDYPCK